MKQFWWSIGRSAFFVGIFIWFQMAISLVIFQVVVILNSGLNEDELMAQITRWLPTISVVSGVMTIVTVLLVLYVRDVSPTEEVGLVPTNGIKPLLQGALMGIGAYGAVMVIMSTVPFPESWMTSYEESASSVAGGFSVVDILATVVIAPVVEEIVFRGLVYRGLKRGMPMLAAALVTSAVFGMLHGTVIWFIYTFLLSLLLIVLLEFSRSLWVPIACHTVFNIVGQLPVLLENAPIWVAMIYSYTCVAVFVLALVWILKDRRAQKRDTTVYPPTDTD